MNTFRAMTRRGILLCLVGLLALLVASPAQPARAASYVVNSLADTNDGTCNASNCTLREAINAAMSSSGADTITFSVNGTINLTSSLPIIASGHGVLTINGGGRSVVIHGGDHYRLFLIQANAVLTLQTLSLSNGYGNYGGAIHNSGTVNLEGVTVQNCKADNDGGGIYTAGNLTVNNSSFSSNFTDFSNGGAIYIYKGQAEINGTSFSGNVSGYSGGAIYVRYHAENQGGDLTIEDATFSGNSAFSGSGGAIANQGDLEITRASFLLNQAEDNGGAFHNQGSFIITESVFGLNSAAIGDGGAVFVENVPTPGNGRIDDSSIALNYAYDNGGGFSVEQGTVSFRRSDISNNVADGSGGGGYNYDGNVYLLHDTIANNDAGVDGGGFYNASDADIEYTTFSGNSAEGNGGALYHATGSEISTLQNSTLYGNSANRGGGIYSRSFLYVINDTISTNSASTAGEGGGINGNVDTWTHNSIATNNTNGGNCNPGIPANWGNNIDSGTTCGFEALYHSHSSTNPLLGPLQDNGGFTKTMMPQSGSLAIDGVTYNPPNRGPEDDQRGYPRPYGSYLDIGAVEAYYRTYLPAISKK